MIIISRVVKFIISTKFISKNINYYFISFKFVLHIAKTRTSRAFFLAYLIFIRTRSNCNAITSFLRYITYQKFWMKPDLRVLLQIMLFSRRVAFKPVANNNSTSANEEITPLFYCRIRRTRILWVSFEHRAPRCREDFCLWNNLIKHLPWNWLGDKCGEREHVFLRRVLSVIRKHCSKWVSFISFENCK